MRNKNKIIEEASIMIDKVSFIYLPFKLAILLLEVLIDIRDQLNDLNAKHNIL